MTELSKKSLTEIRHDLATGEVSAEDATSACLKTIEQTEPRLASRMLDVSLCTICAILAPGYHSDQLSKSPRKKRRKN